MNKTYQNLGCKMFFIHNIIEFISFYTTCRYHVISSLIAVHEKLYITCHSNMVQKNKTFIGEKQI